MYDNDNDGDNKKIQLTFIKLFLRVKCFGQIFIAVLIKARLHYRGSCDKK